MNSRHGLVGPKDRCLSINQKNITPSDAQQWIARILIQLTLVNGWDGPSVYTRLISIAPTYDFGKDQTHPLERPTSPWPRSHLAATMREKVQEPENWDLQVREQLLTSNHRVLEHCTLTSAVIFYKLCLWLHYGLQFGAIIVT